MSEERDESFSLIPIGIREECAAQVPEVAERIVAQCRKVEAAMAEKRANYRAADALEASEGTLPFARRHALLERAHLDRLSHSTGKLASASLQAANEARGFLASSSEERDVHELAYKLRNVVIRQREMVADLEKAKKVRGLETEETATLQASGDEIRQLADEALALLPEHLQRPVRTYEKNAALWAR